VSEKPDEYVFVFEREGPLRVFRSEPEAVAYAEKTDLASRGHVGIFDVHGEALALRPVDTGLALTPIGRNRLPELQSRLAEYQRHLDVLPEAVDPAAYAAVWFTQHEL
jgi:hypothetical protein